MSNKTNKVEKRTIREGDFIYIDYTAKVKENNKIIETTNEEIAKKARIYREDNTYLPRLVIVGKGTILSKVEKELIGANEGDKKTIIISPEEGFGKRDPKKIRVIPAVELSKRGIIPRPNMRVEVNGKIATVRSVGSGRVQLDFNHPLAGKTLIYDVEIKKILERPFSKIEALTKRWIPDITDNDYSINVKEDYINIIFSDNILLQEKLGAILREIALDVKRFLSNYNTVSFTINVPLKKKETKETPKETQKESQTQA